MDITELAIKLIKQYTDEHNRLLRARNRKYRIAGGNWFLNTMRNYDLMSYISVDERAGEREHKRLRRAFLGKDGREARHVFVSTFYKNQAIKEAQKQLDRLEGDSESAYRLEKSWLDDLKQAPVVPRLGKMWQEYLDAIFEEKKAYKSRWEARCAIKGFNKLNLAIKIKFGHMGRNGKGSSRIQFVNIDGFDIPLKKFLDNAEFEQAILAASR